MCNKAVKESNKRLGRRQFDLLYKIMTTRTKGDERIFDRRDNCFQVSNKEVAKRLGLSPSSVDRLIVKCKEKDIIHTVKDIQNKQRLMVDPRFLWFHAWEERMLACAMFDLGSFVEGWKWRKECESLGLLYDCLTGVIIYDPYDWARINKYARSYGLNDRCKRYDRVSKSHECGMYSNENNY